jgi:hypothetical protein
MRQGWPIPFVQVFEWAEGGEGQSRIDDGWPAPDAKRDYESLPLAIDVVLWVAMMAFVLFTSSCFNRTLGAVKKTDTTGD